MRMTDPPGVSCSVGDDCRPPGCGCQLATASWKLAATLRGIMLRRWMFLALLGWACSVASAHAQAGKKKAEEKQPARATFTRDVAPMLAKYCVSCHGGRKPKGQLNLEELRDEREALERPEIWEKVVQRLRAGEMPPEGNPKPAAPERERALSWAEVAAAPVDCDKERDPGRVTIRRLNKAEYRNTIRDLVGIDFKPAEDFPADDVGYGFDNIGDLLTLSPLHLEKYLAAAEKIAEVAFKDPEARKRILIKAEGTKNESDVTRAILRNFARRAYRRPVSEEEVTRLSRFVELAVKNGDAPERGLRLAVQATLVSPHFLFRVERTQRARGTVDSFPITEYELASRLSYFLWSRMPDEELFRLAGAGALRKNLEAQVRRMLRDPRARALTENFAGQ